MYQGTRVLTSAITAILLHLFSLYLFGKTHFSYSFILTLKLPYAEVHLPPEFLACPGVFVAYKKGRGKNYFSFLTVNFPLPRALKPTETNIPCMNIREVFQKPPAGSIFPPIYQPARQLSCPKPTEETIPPALAYFTEKNR